ncbi:hypothetical protein A1D23_08900 [Chelonobacter oris]|uniref:DsbA family protein n=1 Tax=Chelonobacter oris TaxID=505317 RepID=UPI00244A05CF|nr:DsbA family protein [Chelonobacter oris]MDH3000296.1 hypothetical protein [Chelonobacter oris]
MKLHYFYDPLCGWCYAAAPLANAAAEMLPLQLHGGGLMSGRVIDAQFRDYVLPHDARIARLSKQVFGDAYKDGLLKQVGTVLDSAPPITAVLTAEQLDGRGLAMLAQLQKAHYVDGKKVSQRAVLFSLAAQAGYDVERFNAVFDTLAGSGCDKHIAQSRRLMAQYQASGFPTFLLEKNGRFRQLDHHAFYGNPDAWRDALRQWL